MCLGSWNGDTLEHFVILNCLESIPSQTVFSFSILYRNSGPLISWTKYRGVLSENPQTQFFKIRYLPKTSPTVLFLLTRKWPFELGLLQN